MQDGDSNTYVEEGTIEAGLRRFRPIFLTTVTTFFGLVPIIIETSLQAQFIIPMAVSLGFGVLFRDEHHAAAGAEPLHDCRRSSAAVDAGVRRGGEVPGPSAAAG